MRIVLDVTNTLGYLEGLRSNIVASKLGAFTALASLLAAILAACVLLKIAHDYMEGQGITLWTLVRPLVLLILVCNFNTFVATPVHGLCNIFTKSMATKVNISFRDYAQMLGKGAKESFDHGWQKTQQALDETLEKLNGETPETEDKGFLGRAWDKTKMTIGGVFSGYFHVKMSIKNFVYLGLATILLTILTLLAKFVVFCQQVSCYVYLILMMLLGPFSFALAILPSFSNSISSWLAKYIQTCFWIPMGQLVLFINYQLMNTFLTQADDAYGFGMQWIAVMCSAVCIVNVLSVPKICNYVIDSTGVNGAHSQPASIGVRGVRAAGRAMRKLL